jgi:hypothetical protein
MFVTIGLRALVLRLSLDSPLHTTTSYFLVSRTI